MKQRSSRLNDVYEYFAWIHSQLSLSRQEFRQSALSYVWLAAGLFKIIRLLLDAIGLSFLFDRSNCSFLSLYWLLQLHANFSQRDMLLSFDIEGVFVLYRGVPCSRKQTSVLSVKAFDVVDSAVFPLLPNVEAVLSPLRYLGLNPGLLVALVEEEEHTIVLYVSDHPPQRLIDGPYSAVEVPTLPADRRDPRISSALDLHQFEVLLLFNENRVADIGEGNTDNDDCATVVVWEVDAFAGPPSTDAHKYCSFFGLCLELVHIGLISSLLIDDCFANTSAKVRPSKEHLQLIESFEVRADY